MSAAPLVTGMRGPRVLAIQHALAAKGLYRGDLDSKFGPLTAAAAQAAATAHGWQASVGMIVPAFEAWLLQSTRLTRPAPQGLQLHAWVDRRGMLDPETWATEAAGLGLRGVGLFVAPTGAAFKPFVSAVRLRAAIDAYKVRGLDVALLTWVRPSIAYQNALSAYLGPLLQADETLRLHLDTEDQWNRGSFHAFHAKRLWRQWRDTYRVALARIGVTDYAFIQRSTRVLIEAGMALASERHEQGPFGLPQAYSVGVVTRQGVQVWTDEDSIYYPGRTQAAALSQAHWGGIRGLGGRLEPGVAAYKPVRGMSVREQVRTQVQACRGVQADPRVWLWQLAMGSEYRAAVRELAHGGHG